MAQKGTISIDAQNIMPVIKKWLYSDVDIFLRELVSNGCDAIAKVKLMGVSGDFRVDVVADEAAGTVTITDNGIGMTEDEVVRYIGQVAISGATDFIQKYKPEDGENSGIIGHFGLGFYSAFMAADRVQIDTLSFEEGAKAVRWVSEDGMEYELGDSDRAERGTTITLHISEECGEFLQPMKLREILDKYCAFMPVPIYLTEIKPPKAEEAEGDKKNETPEEPKAPEMVNDPNPLWMKRPADVTDDEYKEFYHKVFRDYREPLFWIHLNAEFPFNLKGILYFPKLENEFTSSEGVIKLYNKQVFVADNIKEVIPDFLMLLKGVIDCPDLPLNVSRSFLQNDGYVKKMAAYITRKVADRLVSEFNTKREDYARYWDDIHPFVKYGCIRDEKFFERAKEALLFKTTKGEYVTLKEYVDRNCAEGEKTVFYTSDAKRQAHLIELRAEQGKDVVVLDTMIDNNFISFLEYAEKDIGAKFKRVDAGLDGLTEDGQADEDARKNLEEKFRNALGDKELTVKLLSFKSGNLPAMITVDEENRRFTDMSRQWGEKGFSLPEKRELTLNAKHPLIAYLTKAEAEGELTKKLCEQVVDLAEMARQPLVEGRMVEFLKRSNELLTLLVDR